MTCRVVESKCQKIGARLPIAFDLTSYCENKWAANLVVAANEVFRPVTDNGYEYIVTTAGQFGVKSPSFPKTDVVGTTYASGSAVLTCQLLSNNSLLRTIDTAEWASDGVEDGPQVEDEAIVNTAGEQIVSAFVSCETEGTYLVTCTVEFSDGAIDVFEVEIDVE